MLYIALELKNVLVSKGRAHKITEETRSNVGKLRSGVMKRQLKGQVNTWSFS